MRSFLRSRRARWAVPAVTAVALGAAIGGGTLLAGASSPDLPDKTPAELLADVHDAEPQPFSGTIVQTSRLGLPELPGVDGEHDTTSLLSMLTGSHTARVWYTSPTQARFALMDSFDEVNVIRNGTDVWLWTSSTNTAEHLQVPATLDGTDRPELPRGPATPQQAAERALAALDASTEVTVPGTTEVADRAAYELVISPRDDRSLIADIRLAVDAETSMPLRFEVNARGAQDPAVEVGFTSVTFAEPSPDVYRFNPPPGATVEERSLGELMAKGMQRRPGEHAPGGQHAPGGRPTVVGEDWTSVLVVPDVELPDEAADSPLADALLASGTAVSGEYGSGTLFETALVSALWLDDGTLLVGAVTPDVLEEAASR